MGEGAIITGGIIILFSLWLGYKILVSAESMWFLLYPAVLLGTGIALIVFYKEESKIEGRKDLKQRKKI